MSESGFSGLKDFQDSSGAGVFVWQALVYIPRGGIFGYGEKRDFGRSEILKIPQILKILILTKPRGRPRRSVFPISRDFRLRQDARVGAKRNPENPANPTNPDSDKTVRASPPFRIPDFAGLPFAAKSARRMKRNPENPPNPINPDSDKYAQSPATTSR